MAKANEKSKRSLIKSVACVLLGVIVFVGSTFAWFTYSIPYDRPNIRMGILMIDAYVHKLDSESGKPFTFDMEKWQALKKDPSAFIEEQNWEPGISSAQLIEIVNRGNIDARVRISLDITDEGLIDALWYDFIPAELDEDTGEMILLGRSGVIRKPMKELLDDRDMVKRGELPKDESTFYVLVYGMYENAGNIYRADKSISADFGIVAYQTNDAADRTVSGETP